MGEYLEIKNHDSQTQTMIRMCHNYKNVALLKEMFDENTVVWRSDKSFNIHVNYIKTIVEYKKQHDCFQLTKTLQRNPVVIESRYSPHY